MENGSFTAFAEKYKKKLERLLRASIDELQAPSILKESMLYSLEAGGKRIRPLLLFATLQAFNQNPDKGIYTAAAIEMIHTYSLIHDDLPSMDNDDLRRGKPTNHKVFGEAFAILAGDALLTYSFQLIANMPDRFADANTKLKLIHMLSEACGAEGMVGGQVWDVDGEGKKLSLKELENIHIYKTGKLLQYSVAAGAILANGTKEEIGQLEKFAHHLGLAFQIRDDILDVEGNEAKTGKPVGSDESNLKNTYPFLLSLNGAKEELNRHIQLAKESLTRMKLNTELLHEITELIANRDH